MMILGIDFGEKKIGLAISEGQLAAPLGIILNDKALKQKIKEICQNERVEKIVIGLSEGKMAKRQKEFGIKVAGICGLPVNYQDETLTTQEAIRKMIEAGKKKKSRRLDDAYSAALLLQSYLEANREKL